MINITAIREPSRAVVHPREMEVGQLGRIRMWGAQTERYIDTTVLRSYSCIVSINNPDHTWPAKFLENLDANEFQIELYPTGTQITLEVK